MNNHGRVFWNVPQDVRFDLVLVVLGIVSRHFSAVIAPGFLDHALFSQELGAFQCAFFVGGFEDQAIPEIQSEHTRFFAAERWDK